MSEPLPIPESASVHTSRVRVAWDETDAANRASAAALLRYLQQTAIDHSSGAGYTPERYYAMDRVWLATDTRLDIAAAPGHGDELRVTTWLQGVQRVRVRRRYRVARPDGETLASGSTDWVFLDRTRLRPAAVPDAMHAIFFRDGARPPAPPREPLAPLDEPAAPFVWERTAEWHDLDPERHVNNAVYVAWLESAVAARLAALGWPPERLYAEAPGWSLRSLQVAYERPAVLGDRLQASLWPQALDATRVRFAFVLRRGEQTLVRAAAAWGPAAGEGALPQALIEALAGS